MRAVILDQDRSRASIQRDVRWLLDHGVREMAVGGTGCLEELRGFLGGGAFLVVEAGRPFDFDPDRLRRVHADGPAVATLAIRAARAADDEDDEAVRVERDQSGRVIRMVGGQLGAGLDWTAVGCHVLEPVLLDHLPEPEGFERVTDLLADVLRKHGILAGHVVRETDEEAVSSAGYAGAPSS